MPPFWVIRSARIMNPSSSYSSSRLVFSSSNGGEILGRALSIPFGVQFKKNWIVPLAGHTPAAPLVSHHTTLETAMLPIFDNKGGVVMASYWLPLLPKLKAWTMQLVNATRDIPPEVLDDRKKQIQYLFPLPSDVQRVQIEALGPNSGVPDQAVACAVINRAFEIFDPMSLVPLGVVVVPHDDHIKIVQDPSEANAEALFVKREDEQAGVVRYYLYVPCKTGTEECRVCLPALQNPHFLSRMRYMHIKPADSARLGISPRELLNIKVQLEQAQVRIQAAAPARIDVRFELYAAADFLMSVVQNLYNIYRQRHKLETLYNVVSPSPYINLWPYLHFESQEQFGNVLRLFHVLQDYTAEGNHRTLVPLDHHLRQYFQRIEVS